MIITILAFILILSILVLIHEAGHYFVAKKLGIKVEEFGFGFPPRVWGKQIGETLYSINLLPIGGFVKMYGEDDAGGGKITLSKKKEEKGDLKRAFFARPPWQRLAVVFAGVFMNFLLAVSILTYLYTIPGVPMPGNKVFIGEVSPNSPAATARLMAGDQVIALNNMPITTTGGLINATKKHLGEEVKVTYLDTKGIQHIVSVTPRKNAPVNEGAMGVAVSTNTIVKKYPWYKAPVVGVVETFQTSWMILLGLGDTVHKIITTGKVPAGVAGPVGIARLTGEFIQTGFDATLSLLAMLSLNLAVVNILPIPALDGGRFFFILFELVTKRKVNQQFESYTHTIGMVLLLALILLITFHDIVGIVTHSSVLP